MAADPHTQIPSNATDPWGNPYPQWVVTEADRARFDICHRIAEALWRQYDSSGQETPGGGWMTQTTRAIYRMPFQTGSPDEIDGIAREIAEGKKLVGEAFAQDTEHTDEPATPPVDAPAPEPDTAPESGETTVGKPGSGESSEGGKES